MFLRCELIPRHHPGAGVPPQQGIVVACWPTRLTSRHKKIIATSDAPAAIGPYSQAIRSGNFIFCSGQIPLDPKSGEMVSDDISAQTRRVLDNISGLLKSEGLSLGDVLKTTIFLTDLGNFQIVNEIYGSYFNNQPPARSTV